MLLDTCYLLNSSSVKGIFNLEDYENIYKVARKECIENTIDSSETNMLQFYQKALGSNLHIVIALSPTHEDFRANLRNFPALVNCSVID